MTDTISKAAKDRASALIHESVYETQLKYNAPACMLTERNGAVEALARVLQEHSDIAKAVMENESKGYCSTLKLQSMILPDDEPDRLAEVAEYRMKRDASLTGQQGVYDLKSAAAVLVRDLDAAGYEIRRKDG